MKQTKIKLLCLLLAALMLLSSLTACGKDKAKDSNLIKLGDYELLYKGACIMEDSDGSDAIVLTLDFTNNGKENASYLWSVDETLMQNGVELEAATVFADYDTFETVIEGQFTDVAPGATVEVRTAYLLQDTTSPVEATFEQFLGKKSGKITIDPSSLNRETPTADTTGDEPPVDSTLTSDPAETGDALLDWWNGEWYGWWKMSGCYGYYESMEGKWWDVCGVIDIGTDYTGTITLWDEDYTRSEPMASAQVSLSEAGTGEHGTVMSEGGWFTNVALEHADWIVDPALLDYDDMIWISGDYEDGDDEFHYDIYLRPWGLYWDDMEEDTYPYRYTDWYLPLIDAGKSMPDAIGENASEEATPTEGSQPTSTDAAASGGDGIVTEEQVQKGYVWMNEVNKNIFYTVYFVASVQEEVGCRGAGVATRAIHPDIGIAVDVGFAKNPDFPTVDVEMGKGPIIAVGPNCNYNLVKKLREVSVKYAIACQTMTLPVPKGTDASVMQIQNDGVFTGVITIPLMYMHTPAETITMSDLEKTGRLLSSLVIDLDGKEFVGY